MPVRFDEQTTIQAERFTGDLEFEPITPDFRQILQSAFAIENTLGSLLVQESGLPDSVVDTEFNPFEQMTEAELLDNTFVSNAALADTPAELEAVRRQSAKERKNRKVLSDAGALGALVTISAGIFDPINLIPVGGTAYRTYKTGSSILSGAISTASVATGSAAITEMSLHATQLERTYSESAINMTGAMLLGGALGGGVASLKNRNMKTIGDEISDSMNVEPKIAQGEDSVGAARVSQNVQIKGKAARVISKSLAFDPLTRSLTNRSQVARDLAATLAENPYEMDGLTGSAVESLIKIHDGKYVTALEKHLELYGDFQKELGGNTGLQRIYNRKGMSRRQFNEAVSRELRNPSSESAPQIKQAAEAWRNNLYDPLKNDLIEQKLLPEDVDVTTATNYLNRIWDPGKISANEPEFIRIVSKWLADQDAAIVSRGEELDTELRALNRQIDNINKKGGRATPEQLARLNEIESQLEPIRKRPDLELQEYEDVAAQIAQRIKGTPDGRLPYDWRIGEGSNTYPIMGTKLRGPLRERTFNIADDLVEDFLENDIETLGARYLRNVAPDLELSRAFGDVEMTTQFKQVEVDYRNIRRKAKTDKQRLKLDREFNQAISDISAMRDRIRGIYGNVDHDNPWVRTARAIRDLNYLRFMGGVVASSIPDLARVFMSEGFGNTFSKGLKPLISNLKGFRVASAEAKRYGVGVDALMGGRSQIIADVADYTRGGTAIERGLRAASDKFGQVNMMDYWTGGVKQLHAVVMQNRVIPQLISGKPSSQVVSKLRRLGINGDDARLIGEQLKKYGQEIDGVWLANAKNWDDPLLERVWGAALRKESDRVIVIPGQEKPLFMSTELGKSIFQFRSFMFSATQRMMIAGIQGQEANYFGGMAMLLSLGMMAYAFKQWDAGREISDDPAVWLAEGIDRSGSLGMIMEINNTVEKISGNNLGIRPLIGASQPASRFASRSQIEAMLGPTFGSFASTTLQVAAAGTDANEWKESDTRALRRLLPYQNLTFLRQGFDKIEESLQ